MGIFDFLKKEAVLEVNENEVEEIENKYYYNGELFTGKMIGYDEDGNVIEILLCKKGNIISPIKQYYPSDSIELISCFDEKGATCQTAYSLSGEIKYEIKYVNGYKIKRIDYYPSGKIKRVKPYTYVERYNDSVPHGEEITYDEHGKKIYVYNWKYGLPS